MWCRQGTGLHNGQAVEAGRIRFETAHDSRKKYATSINSETYSVVTFQALGNQIEMAKGHAQIESPYWISPS